MGPNRISLSIPRARSQSPRRKIVASPATQTNVKTVYDQITSLGNTTASIAAEEFTKIELTWTPSAPSCCVAVSKWSYTMGSKCCLQQTTSVWFRVPRYSHFWLRAFGLSKDRFEHPQLFHRRLIRGTIRATEG